MSENYFEIKTTITFVAKQTKVSDIYTTKLDTDTNVGQKQIIASTIGHCETLLGPLGFEVKKAD